MIGLSELLVIAIISIILFKPNDYKNTLKFIIINFRKFQSFVYQTKNFILSEDIKKEIDEIKDQIISANGKKYIYGDDDKLHEIFDLSDIETKSKIKLVPKENLPETKKSD
jgi:Sec-independent protein translocase protein TatA